ncbi:MAG: glycosyl hydrolase family 28 protein [Bacteroidia bacterium]|nr:glycosyl hydrolase family 28 protein [Bacteroidia bacterium]
MVRFFALVFVLKMGWFSLAAQPGVPSFSVKDYGASGEKSQKATAFIQKTLDICAEAGGGIVYFPPGEYVSGSLRIFSNTTLWLESGATLYASQDTSDYTTYRSLSEPVLLFADSAHHIALRGKGTIHGQARRVYEDLKAVDGFIRDITENAREAGVEMKMYYKVKPHVRLVVFEHSTDITIEDISLIESCSWTLDLKQCQRVYVRGVYIQSSLEAGVNADGIDVDGCRDVVISDCIVTTGDDAIVLKANFTRGVQHNCENVTITNCVVTSTSAGLKLGTESYGDFRHITFNNCVVRNSNRGLSIVVRDGGTVENVLFSNITIETNRKHFNWWGNGDPIWIVLRKRRPNSKLGFVRNVVFENIVATGQGTSRIEGYAPDSLHPEGRRLENIQFRNVQLKMEAENYLDKRADWGFEAHDVNGLKVEGMEITWDTQKTEPGWKGAVHLYDCDEVRMKDFTGRQGLSGSNFPVIFLENVPVAVLDNIEALPGASTLVEIGGQNVRSIRLIQIDPLERASEKFRLGKEVNKKVVQVR